MSDYRGMGRGWLVTEVERLKREEKNDLVAYKAAILRQEELRSELDLLKDENKSLRNDAERYRYVRWSGVLKRGDPMETYFVYNADCDAYVDGELANRSPENP